MSKLIVFLALIVLVSAHELIISCSDNQCTQNCNKFEGENQKCLSNPNENHSFIFEHNHPGHGAHTNDTEITLKIYSDKTCGTLLCSHNYTVDYQCSSFPCGNQELHLYETRPHHSGASQLSVLSFTTLFLILSLVF